MKTLGNEIECCIENGLRAKSLEDSLEEITNRISNYEIGAWVEDSNLSISIMFTVNNLPT